MSSKTCPACGRDDFKSNRGMRMHHKKAHGESLSIEQRNCKYCGSEFDCKISDDRSFCSQDCVSSWRSEEWEGKNLSGSDIQPEVVENNDSSVTFKCINCGCEKTVSSYRFENEASKYCSLECKYKFTRSENLEVECSSCGDTFRVSSESEKDRRSFCSRECQWSNDGQGIKDIISNCENCGDEFWRNEYDMNRRSGNTFCSHSCAMEYQKKERVECECEECGEKFELLKSQVNSKSGRGRFCSKSCLYDGMRTSESGYHGYGNGWSEIKKSIRKRDNHTCQACGLGQNKMQAIFGQKLHVHHIEPFKLSEDNSRGNLLTLCIFCHTRLEGSTHREPNSK